MLSRVFLVTRLAPRLQLAAAACRFSSTTPPNPPSKGATATSSTPFTTQKVTQGPGSPSSPAAPGGSGPSRIQRKHKKTKSTFDFKRAQMTLPKRLYSRSGVIASKVYALTEHQFPSNKVAEVNKVAESLVTLRNELNAHPKASKAFLSPVLRKEQKSVFITSLNKLLKIHPLVQGLTLSLVKRNQTALFPKVVEDFLALKDIRDDVVKVTVTLASQDQPKPKPETVRSLLSYGPKTQIQLQFQYDPAIEGGAVIRAPSKVIDLTFRRDLRKLRSSLEQKQTARKNARRAKFDKAWAETIQKAKQVLEKERAAGHLDE